MHGHPPFRWVRKHKTTVDARADPRRRAPLIFTRYNTHIYTQREAGKKETASRKQQNGASVEVPPPLADSKRQSKAAESRVSKQSTHAASQKDKKKPRPTAYHVDAIEQTPEFVEVTNPTPVHQCRTTRMCHTFAAHA